MRKQRWRRSRDMLVVYRINYPFRIPLKVSIPGKKLNGTTGIVILRMFIAFRVRPGASMDRCIVGIFKYRISTIGRL